MPGYLERGIPQLSQLAAQIIRLWRACRFFRKMCIRDRVNPILKEDELKETARMIWELYRIGVDALLVQDLSLIHICRTLAELNFGKKYGIHVVSILRGKKRLNIPGASVRLFPQDKIQVIACLLYTSRCV